MVDEQLRPNRLVVDKLTEESLQSKLKDIQNRLDTFSQLLSEKEVQLAKCQQDLSNTSFQDRTSLQ